MIFCGLQASGKTTFFRERLATTHAHVSKDNFRSNRRPERRQRQLIEEAFAQGRSVAVDNTNPTAAERVPLVQLGRAAGARVVACWFDAKLQECLERNRGREGKARVPEVALRVTQRRLVPPAPEEGYDEIREVRLVPGAGFAVRTLWPIA